MCWKIENDEVLGLNLFCKKFYCWKLFFYNEENLSVIKIFVNICGMYIYNRIFKNNICLCLCFVKIVLYLSFLNKEMDC